MRDAENIKQAEQAGVDWMGFIFYPKSPRWVGAEEPEHLPACTRVGVFVDMPMEEMLSHIQRWRLHAVQLHGKESPAVCQALRKRGLTVIKAFSVGKEGIPDNVQQYADHCDYFLFDTACPCVGGSGKQFDWSVLADYSGPVPFLLSGGLNPQSVASIRAFAHPKFAGIDLNSGFEIAPALKDTEKVKCFIKQLK